MTDPFALCTQEMVTIAVGQGEPLSIIGWRFGDLAATRRIGPNRKPILGWTITHLPTGMAFSSAGCTFERVEQAAAALLEISRLKNTWALIEEAELPALGPKIYAIAQKHGAVPMPTGKHRGDLRAAPRRNGYEEMQ